jgi:hypothetical protein
VVLAGSGDPLLSLDYTRQVFARIVATAKELLVIDSDRHLRFTETLDRVLPVLVPRLLGSAPAAAAAGASVPM